MNWFKHDWETKSVALLLAVILWLLVRLSSTPPAGEPVVARRLPAALGVVPR